MSDSQSFDFASLVERINEQNREHVVLCAQRKERALAEAHRLAQLLKGDISVTRVWGFGSTFEESRPYHEHSDIDLAIEGGDFYRAVSLVSASEFKVDLVDITNRDDFFAQSIRKLGKLLTY